MFEYWIFWFLTDDWIRWATRKYHMKIWTNPDCYFWADQLTDYYVEYMHDLCSLYCYLAETDCSSDHALFDPDNYIKGCDVSRYAPEACRLNMCIEKLKNTELSCRGRYKIK